MQQGIDDRLIHDRLNIRRMTKAEVLFAIDLAAEEGWNPGIHDGACFYAADPHGFFVGELDGEPVCSISAVSYGDSFGFMGLFVVNPGYRGEGIGTLLAKEGLAYLAGRNIGLDGVVEQQQSYQRYGFRIAYRNLRYEGVGGGSMPEGAVEVSEVPFEELLEYDALMFSEARPEFLKCWINQPGGAALAVVNEGGITGYGVIRQCRVGYKIGPLFADNKHIAETLFAAFRSRVPDGQPIFLDAPEVNLPAVELAERNRMSVVFETARMYSGDEPPISLDRVFGVTTFELG